MQGRGVAAEATLARRVGIINHLDDSNQVPWLASHEITLLRGSARLKGERRVRVGEDVLEAP